MPEVVANTRPLMDKANKLHRERMVVLRSQPDTLIIPVIDKGLFIDEMEDMCRWNGGNFLERDGNSLRYMGMTVVFGDIDKMRVR